MERLRVSRKLRLAAFSVLAALLCSLALSPLVVYAEEPESPSTATPTSTTIGDDYEVESSDVSSDVIETTGESSILDGSVEETPSAEPNGDLETPADTTDDSEVGGETEPQLPEVGLYDDGTGLRYSLGDGTFAIDSWQVVDGSTYYFKRDGYAARWGRTIDGEYYYFDSQCRMVTGWVVWSDDGARSYWSDDGARSYFGSDGAALSGWKDQGGYRYYLDPDRADHRSVRWGHTIDGASYYFDSACRMHVGPLRWGSTGKWSLFGADGRQVLSEGWQTYGGRRYYVCSDGYCAQWGRTIDGEYYYFDSQCRMVTGWVVWSDDGARSYRRQPLLLRPLRRLPRCALGPHDRW